MKKLFFYSPNYNDACSYYRGIAPFSRLDVNLSIPSNSVSWSTVVGSDIAFLQRPCTEQHLGIAKIIKRQGIPLWLDYDDDLINVPLENPAYGFFSRLIGTVKEIVALADIITVTTQTLKDLYSSINPTANIIVIPNAWDDYLWGTERSNIAEQEKTIFWRGSDSHIKDLMEVANDLVEVKKEYPEWKFVFMGMNPWFLQGRMEYGHIPPVDIMEYYPILKDKWHPSITIVPLTDNVFNKGKSNISWIEGTYSKSLVLAPGYLPEFNNVHGISNYSSNTGLNFKNQLTKLIEFSEEITYDSTYGTWEYIKENLLLSNTNKQRQEIINSV